MVISIFTVYCCILFARITFLISLFKGKIKTYMLLLISGLLLWNESRLQWIGSEKSSKPSQQKREPRLKYVKCISFGPHLNEYSIRISHSKYTWGHDLSLFTL